MTSVRMLLALLVAGVLVNAGETDKLCEGGLCNNNPPIPLYNSNIKHRATRSLFSSRQPCYKKAGTCEDGTNSRHHTNSHMGNPQDDSDIFDVMRSHSKNFFRYINAPMSNNQYNIKKEQLRRIPMTYRNMKIPSYYSSRDPDPDPGFAIQWSSVNDDRKPPSNAGTPDQAPRNVCNKTFCENPAENSRRTVPDTYLVLETED